MNNSPDIAEALDLAFLVHEELASPDQISRLELLCMQSRPATEAYLAFTRIRGNVYRRARGSSALAAAGNLQLAIDVELEDVPPKSNGLKDRVEVELPSRTSIAAPLSALGPRQSPWFLACCTALVALCLYGTFTLVAWNLRPDKLPSNSIAEPDMVAVVRDDADVQWSKSNAGKSVESSILPGESLKIDAGLVCLELSRGATVVVEGPADWSIDGDNHATLRSGKLIARVPRKAMGFTVSTPTAEVIDLGTEFGVDVGTAGRTDVQVLEGAVNVDYSSSDDKSKSARRSVRMTAGNTRRFSAEPGKSSSVGTVEIAPWLDKSASVAKFLDSQQNRPVEKKYAAAVLADEPLGYWRFSDIGGHRATDSSGHGNHGEYVGFVSMKEAGICPNTSDRSVRFLGKQYAGYVQIKDFELPASFSVELWARSSAPGWQNYGWLLSSRMLNGLVISPVPPGPDWQVFMINSSGDGRVAGTSKITNIADRFHHYVFSYDAAADRGTMYIDGALMRETADVFKDIARREAARLTFYVGRDDRSEDDAWGEGSIDELAIYATVLSPEAVKRHYEASEDSGKP